jgi:type I restriction enzyme, S subunit
MRDGWVETKLVDAVEVLDRFRKPINSTEREGRQGSVPYYGANGQAGWIDDSIFNEELVLLGEDAIDFADPNARKAYLISGPSWVNNHAHVLRAKPEKVYSYFLAESLNKVDYSQYVSFGTRSKLTQGSMNGIKVLLPPLPEQKRIVDLLSSVDSYIESLQQQLEGAKKSRNAVLHELMTARGNDWVVRKLPEVVEVLDRMRKPINSTEREDRKGNIPYYGANGQTGWIDEFIFNEELVLLGEDAIDFADPSARKAYLIQGPSWVNNHAHVLRADTTIINSYFLMESLNKVDYSQYVSFGTRSKLTQASMNGIKVLVPSMKNQEKIVDLLANFDEVIEATQKSIGDSKVLRSGMLSNLLSGEHEIPTSYDKFIGAA